MATSRRYGVRKDLSWQRRCQHRAFPVKLTVAVNFLLARDPLSTARARLQPRGDTMPQSADCMRPDLSIAHYRINAKLGKGGMGEVYRATDTRLNREVAVKVLPESMAADDSRMARFEREAQLLASLNHPNIAAIYGIELACDERNARQGAIVMELVDGPMLSGPLSLSTVLDYARQIAEGLEYAHDRSVIHRDLKPANIRYPRDRCLHVARASHGKAGRPSQRHLFIRGGARHRTLAWARVRRNDTDVSRR
jgi:hypothetical protein